MSAGDAVTVAYVHPNEVTDSWHQSLLAMIGHDLRLKGHVVRGGWLAIRCYGADGIGAARNTAVQQFMSEKDSDWLLWIDTDMGFSPDIVDRLLAVADPESRPIVGGLCFAQKQGVADGMGGWTTSIVPTIYDWTELPTGEQGFLSRDSYPVNSVVRCAGTGSACILIHRNVFKRMLDKFGTWYDRVPNPTADGRLMGEDLSFCMRAGALDIPIYVNTAVKTTHFKPSWLAERDFWRQVVAEPAAEDVAVLVPVYGRPEAATPFMRSLRASTGLATVYAVVGPEDAPQGRTASAEAWQAAGAQVIYAEHPAFGPKINLGFRLTHEPWVFMVGDDVRFHPGWLDHAQAVAGDKFDVVGTNDLSNPNVSGNSSPHLLIRRSYVEESGASFDGPGVVCHEGYTHNFVDTEICVAARGRNAWAMALGSVVEHLHPLWQKGAIDDVYRRGVAAYDKDQKLFQSRIKKFSKATDAS